MNLISQEMRTLAPEMDPLRIGTASTMQIMAGGKFYFAPCHILTLKSRHPQITLYPSAASTSIARSKFSSFTRI